MVERISISPPLEGQMLKWHPDPRVGQQASCCLQATSHTTWKRWFVDCPTLPRGAWMQGLPSEGLRDHWVIWHEEKVALAMALQRCTVHSKMPPGMLCRAVQELHRYLTSVIESCDLVNLKMLDVARRDPMAPTSKGSTPLLTPTAEPPVGVPIPSEPTASEPGEAATPEELTLVPRWRPLAPPGFSLSWVDESGSPLPQQADWPMSVPLGAQLDCASLDSLQVTILHFPAMGEVQCEYQSWTVALTSLTQVSLQLALPKPQINLTPLPRLRSSKHM